MTFFKTLINNKKHHFIGILIFNLYFFIYYWSIGYLNFLSDQQSLTVFWLANKRALLFRATAPFLYEPIGKIEFYRIQLLVSPMNILIGFVLGFLVYLNILAVLYLYTMPKQCRIDYKVHGIWGILPSFLTGFACCAPSFLIPLSTLLGSTTVFAIRVFRWFLPFSFLVLTYGVYTSYRKIKKIQI